MGGDLSFRVFLYALYQRPPPPYAHVHALLELCAIWIVLLGRNLVHIGTMSYSGAPCLPSASLGLRLVAEATKDIENAVGQGAGESPEQGFSRCP